MIFLVDTSVWINFFQKGDKFLDKLLSEGNVLIHPFIIGEIICGSLKNRNEIIELLQALPKIDDLTPDEVFFYIEKNKLYAKGLGYIDLHLMAMAAVSRCNIYTLDKKILNNFVIPTT